MGERYLPENWADFHSMWCGELIGEGVARKVYAFALDPLYVVKIETANRDWQNIHEWDLWNAAGRKTAKWLAPCHSISDGGTVLLQRRAEPIPADRLPKLVPSFLADLAQRNWGLVDGRPVAIDYGRHHAFASINQAILIKAEW